MGNRLAPSYPALLWSLRVVVPALMLAALLVARDVAHANIIGGGCGG